MFSELKECSVIWKGKQETENDNSKVEKLKMNPVGDPNQRDCDKSFHSHCPGDCADSEDFSLLHWDLKRLLREMPETVGFGGWSLIPWASNTDVPVACSDVCACSFDR